MAQRSETVKLVFVDAVETHSVTVRASFLDKACAGDAALRRKVERWWRHTSAPKSGWIRLFGATEHLHIGGVALAALDTAWDQAEPGIGYDIKAGEWVHGLVGILLGIGSASIPPLVIRAWGQSGDRTSQSGPITSSHPAIHAQE